MPNAAIDGASLLKTENYHGFLRLPMPSRCLPACSAESPASRLDPARGSTSKNMTEKASWNAPAMVVRRRAHTYLCADLPWFGALDSG
jgi:hypothetical protein